ncbi:MAG TPA: ABC transporter permease, partial [Candidatus Paenibacillus intestinavium]|nr:ABC transporter permease [Candidatus Paenibacillus intestinavium]
MELISNLLNGTLVFSTALIFAALGGLISERSGVINIGLEGFMISGAFFSAVAAYYAESAGFNTLSPWIGLIGAFVFTIIFS